MTDTTTMTCATWPNMKGHFDMILFFTLVSQRKMVFCFCFFASLIILQYGLEDINLQGCMNKRRQL